MKTCVVCGSVKPMSDFANSQNTKDKLRTECRKCGNSAAISHRRKIRDMWSRGEFCRPSYKLCPSCQIVLSADKFSETTFNKTGLTSYCMECAKKKCYEHRRNNIKKDVIVRSRHRAKRLGLEFSITVDDIEIPDRCPILGIDLYVRDGIGPKNHSPSIDRIDNSKGYVPGNVVVISNKINRIKGNLTIQQLIDIADFYKQFL